MTSAHPGTNRAVMGVLATLSLAMLLPSLGTSIANVGLPTLAVAFNATFQDVQWVVLAYLLAITTLVVSVGRLGDVMGRRRLMLAGIVVFTVASALCGAAPSLPWLVAARAIQGLGAAVMMALTLAFVGDAVPDARTGSAMGMLGTMSAIGTALGPSLGGALIAVLNWRAVFFVSVPLGIVAFSLAYRFLPPSRAVASAERAAFDHAGTVILAITLASYALAMTVGRGQFGAINVLLLLGAIVGALVFVRIESAATSPLIHIGMLRNPALSAGFAMSALVSAVVMATLVVGPFYLTGAFALDAARVGLVMSVGPIVSALAGVPAGRLVDRFGASRLTIAGLAAMVVGCSILPLMTTSAGVLGYIAPLATVTAGYALFQAANNTAVMSGVSADQRGVTSGVLNLSRNLGLITGASAMGAVFAFGSTMSRAATRPEAVAGGMKLTFGVAAALVGVALGFASVRQAPLPPV